MTKVKAINEIISRLSPETAGGETIAECLGILTDIYAGVPQTRQTEISNALAALGMVLPQPGGGGGGGGGENVDEYRNSIQQTMYIFNKPGQVTPKPAILYPNLQSLTFFANLKAAESGHLQIRIDKDKVISNPTTFEGIVFGSPYSITEEIIPDEYKPVDIYIPGDLFTGTTNKMFMIQGMDQQGPVSSPDARYYKINLVVDCERFDLSTVILQDPDFMVKVLAIVLANKIDGVLVLPQDLAGKKAEYDQILQAKGYTTEFV